MKKIFAVCLAAAMLLTACGSSKESSEEKFLYDQGIELISLMGEMAQSDAYFNMFSSAPQIKDAVADVSEAAAAGTYQTPKAVYRISIGDESLAGLLNSAAGADMDFGGMSEDLQAYMQSRIFSSCASILNSPAGAEALAASSIYMCSSTFVCSEASENTAYLYTYADACPVLVTFLVGEGHAVYASGTYILNKNITDGDSISALFGFSGFRAEPLSP